MPERLRRLSNSQRRDKELAKRARRIDLQNFYSRKDLERLRESAGQIIKPEYVDDFLKIQVVKFGKLPQDDRRREMGRVGYVENTISSLHSPTFT